MNWKIIVGGLLIFAGTAQFLKLLAEYRYNNPIAVSIGLGFLFICLLITGIYLVRRGRKDSRKF